MSVPLFSAPMETAMVLMCLVLFLQLVGVFINAAPVLSNWQSGFFKFTCVSVAALGCSSV